ncbi:MAG TPA: hypothetical protein VJU83_07710, partial [Burkholderiales bacterium]|nr:hypothetical protein [Burkholderiales bacterium]
MAVAAVALSGAEVYAQEAPAFPAFSFSGFGTVGVVRSSEDEANFVAHDLQGGGAGRDKEWSADVDSRLGLQVTAAFTPQLSAVLQVVTEQDYDGSFRPDVEWANIKYEFTPDFSVRVGRVVLGSFLATDYRKVGYAQHWVRPPVEVYGLIPMTHNDGVDVSYRVRWGDVSHNLQAAFGDFKEHVPAGQEVKSDNGWTVSDTIEYGAATLRLTYSRSRFSIETLEPLWNGYREIANNPVLQMFAPAAVADANRILDEYDTMDTKSTF